MRERYDDSGFSGGSMELPALQKLLADVRARTCPIVMLRGLTQFHALKHGWSLRNV